mgnify:CR=1 FL=1
MDGLLDDRFIQSLADLGLWLVRERVISSSYWMIWSYDWSAGGWILPVAG